MLPIIKQLESCDQGPSCRNSVENRGKGGALCGSCRLSPENEDYPDHHWSSKDKSKHPVLEDEKKEFSKLRNIQRQLQRASKDRGKQKLLKKAVKAEKKTERVIESTINSGRSFMDGDHLALDSITLDTKLQTTKINPTVYLHELDKVRHDARRAGSMFGALILRSANGVGVVAIAEQDFALLLKQLKEGHSGTS